MDDSGDGRVTGRRLPAPLLLVSVLLFGALAIADAYWPGLMTWDAVRQYGQALDGDFDDWHPPAMGWLWRQLLPFGSGPAPMLVVQLGLYWGGFAGIAGWALRERRPMLAGALAACAFLPLALALMGAVLKDCLMAATLLSATGLLLWTGDAPGRIALRLVAVVLLLFAAALRFNALPACLPLLVMLAPAQFRDRPSRLLVVGLVATLALVAALPLANRALGAKPSGVALSLVIFDLGGITEHSGVNVFPAMDVANPVAVNHRCYTPVKWDSYSFWVDPVCPLGFEPFQAVVASGVNPYRLWLSAILTHPIAYAEHRLAHFNINTRFLVHDEIERPVQVESAPNDWRYVVHPSGLLRTIDSLATASAATPLGWPIVWIALALGSLLAGAGLESRRITVPLALSSLLYGLGYGVFSVASELRYHLWTMLAALIATVLVMADTAAQPVPRWRQLAAPYAPAVLVTMLATAWRVLP